MNIRNLVFLATLAILAPLSSAEELAGPEMELQLKGGGVIAGTLVEETETSYEILTPHGAMHVPKNIVEGGTRGGFPHLAPSPPDHQWQEAAKTAVDASVEDGLPPHANRSADSALKPMPLSLPAARSLPLEERFEVEEGEFTIASKMPNNPEVRVVYRVPMTAFGRPTPGAADIVFYAPFINEGNPLNSEYIRQLTTEHGLTVFSMVFKSSMQDVEDPELIYYYEESGSFEVVLSAWNRLRNTLRVQNRKLIVLGNSGGSSMAQRFSARYPQHVEAVALMGGSRYVDTLAVPAVPHCVLMTRGDIRWSENLDLFRRAMADNRLMHLGVTPAYAHKVDDFSKFREHNFNHSAHNNALDILSEFVVSIRDTRAGTIPGSERASAETPMRFLATDEAADLREFENQPQTAFSQRFMDAWDRNPYRFARLDSEGLSLPVWVRYPEDSNARGIMLYAGPDGAPSKEVGDGLDFLALHGWLAVGVVWDGEPSERLEIEDWEVVMDWIKSQSAWTELPIYWMGWGDSGQNFLLKAAEAGEHMPAGVVAFDAPLVHPRPERSPIAAIEKASALPAIVLGSRSPNYGENVYVQDFLTGVGKQNWSAQVLAPPAPLGSQLELDWLLIRDALKSIEQDLASGGITRQRTN